MKGTSSWVEGVLHGIVQQGSSRTNVCLSSALRACIGTPLLSDQAHSVFNFSNMAFQGWPGKGIKEQSDKMPHVKGSRHCIGKGSQSKQINPV